MRKLIIIFSLSCLILSVLLVNVLSVEFCMANNLHVNDLRANDLRVNDLQTNTFVKNIDDAKNVQNISFFMTDAKHKRFRKANRDYVLADTMLNFTWNAIKKQSSKDEFAKRLKEQRFWLEKKRDAVANSFSLHLSEVNAFTLAIVARTQELANQISTNPEEGMYFYSQKNIPQSGHINVSIEGASLLLHGQNFAKNGRVCEIEGRGSAFGKGWISLTTPENDKFFVLFTRNTAYLVHDIIGACGKNVSFQGVYIK